MSVCPGTYVENITINKANLTVSSTGGYGVTIIRASVVNSVVTVTGVNATVAGFTLVPSGSTAKYDIGVFVRKMERLYEILHQTSRVSGRAGVLQADLRFLANNG